MQTKKGKNFSRNRPRSDRSEADYYQTPYCLTQAFVNAHVKENWGTHGTIADYCSGDGAIVKVLYDNGYRVEFGDIRDPIQTDFFNIGPRAAFAGIMNPPFRLFNKWVDHCFEVFERAFALLAPTTYLQGIGRYNAGGSGIFQRPDYPLTHIYTFNRYPMLSANLRPDGLIETGMQALSWFVWTQREYDTETVHRWLDIDSYVLRKGKPVKN
jgi:hypothetical protein